MSDLKKIPEYRAWCSMRERCNRVNNPYFYRYGGRGIKVCDEWNSYAKFRNDVGERPSPKHTLDRIHNDGDYEPTNVRWATKQEQANNRHNNTYIEHNGKKQTIATWAREYGIKYTTLIMRLQKYGYTVEEALKGVRNGK